MADIPRNIYPSQRQATGGYEEAKAPIQGQQDHVPEMGVFVTGGQDRRDMQDDHSPELGAFAAYEEYDDYDDYDEDGHPISILVSKVKPEQVRWLWPGRIPLGKLTLLDGDPGLGKSLLTLDLAARVTTGRAMPDVPDTDSRGFEKPAHADSRGFEKPAHAGRTEVLDARGGAWLHPPDPCTGSSEPRDYEPIEGGVVLLSSEDDLAATICPRLVAACADLSRVRAMQTVYGLDVERGVVRERGVLLPQDVDFLAHAIARAQAKLVVIDPLMAYLDGRVNSWRDQDVRAALAPLARLAEQTGAAILVLRHLTKGGGSNALYRGGGSIGIIGAARSGLLVAKHPERPEEERVLASSKSNLGPPMPALGYRILATQDARGTSIPRIEWLGATSYTAASLLAAADRIGTEGVGEPSRLEEACAFLRETLAEGPRPAAEVERLARGYGISDHTLRRARRELSVTAQHDGRSGQWAITLPPTALF